MEPPFKPNIVSILLFNPVQLYQTSLKLNLPVKEQKSMWCVDSRLFLFTDWRGGR